eukprot:1422527-Rhodomonas_salina.2
MACLRPVAAVPDRSIHPALVPSYTPPYSSTSRLRTTVHPGLYQNKNRIPGSNCSRKQKALSRV